MCFPPRTCHLPAVCAYFMNKPSTNSVLYVSCCMFLPMTCLQATTELGTVDFIGLLKSLRYHLVILIQPCTYAATGPSSWPPICCDYNQSHTKASLFLPFLEALCMSTLWSVDTIVTFFSHTILALWLDPSVSHWFLLSSVSYLALPRGHSSCSN